MPEDHDEVLKRPDNEEPDEGDVPASVTFMALMRHAAAKAESQQAAAPPPRPVRPAAPATLPEAKPATPPPPAAASQPTTPPRTPRQPAPPPSEPQWDDAMEAQRIRRVKRRQARRRQRTVGVLGGIIRSVIVMLVAAGLMATIFTWATPTQFLNTGVRAELSIAQATNQVAMGTSFPTLAPTRQPTPNWLRRVGIVSGHRGPQVPPDPGAVCPDGLTEAEINFAVSQKVVRNLRAVGYSVDLLDEFDLRLENYQAAALVSIHVNTCKDFGERVSGYLIARAAARSGNSIDDLLVNCIAQYYSIATGLERRDGVTIDMTDYHSFREISPLTPASIIELGFLLADRDVLTSKQDEMAQGISSGIICFLEPGNLPPTPVVAGTPSPAASPSPQAGS